MQDALQDAVARMAKQDGGGGGNGAPNPMSVLLAVLPKLLANNEERDELVEKLEDLEKGTFSPLQEQVQGLRKQIHRVFKIQQEIVDELRSLREQQTAVGNAVLHLAQQLARVEIVDDLPDDSDEEYDDAPSIRGRSSNQSSKPRRRAP
jgi:hypothetical protein